MKNEELWKLIHEKHPFEDLSLENIMLDDDMGWRWTYDIYDNVIREYKPSRIIEVGSWKGGSAIRFIESMKKYGIENPLIICVDTFLGGIEHWNREAGGFYHLMKIKNGHPSIYNYFISNIYMRDLQQNILPIVNTSNNAFKILDKNRITADMVYIDGSHEYEDVIRDLDNYWKLVNPGGVLLGDDILWDGVNKAVKEFSKKIKLEYSVYDDTFFLFKKEK